MATPEEERLRMEYEHKFTAIDERIDTHDKKIIELQSEQRAVKEQITRLENVVTSENRETRAIFLSTMDKQWDLIKSRDFAAEKKAEMTHDLEKTREEMRHDMQKTKWGLYGIWLAKFFGAGGLFYGAIELIRFFINK